ncbi:MAG: YggT family protein [Anaerolineales bacterium]|nr:YggT family protein [Anaerolineales bacterium]MCX7609389.1 YggT family protein [Anaerolineales bacterium]MDW8227200.1 YggT family protein [Anaerolineales bacterium]
MISGLVVQLIDLVADLLVLIVIADVILSYFLSPYHSVRAAFDRIVEPMLAPIRRFVPTLGGLDFSPLILIVLIQVISYFLKTLLYSL